MKAKLRRQLQRRKRRTRSRIDPENWSGRSPMIKTPAVKYELAEKQQAIAAGGIGVMMQLIQKVKLRREINQSLSLLKLHLIMSSTSR